MLWRDRSIEKILVTKLKSTCLHSLLTFGHWCFGTRRTTVLTVCLLLPLVSQCWVSLELLSSHYLFSKHKPKRQNQHTTEPNTAPLSWSNTHNSSQNKHTQGSCRFTCTKQIHIHSLTHSDSTLSSSINTTIPSHTLTQPTHIHHKPSSPPHPPSNGYHDARSPFPWL